MVSRSHVIVEFAEGIGLRLHSISSINGIVLVAPNGRESDVPPGGSAVVTGPCEILLGGVRVGIERAA